MKKSLISLGVAALISGVAGSALAAHSVPGTGAPLTPTVVSAGTNQLHETEATELRLTPGGIGHMLLVPYFSTQGGNVTLLNLVNTDQKNGKAVKIRFRGAGNSDDILDFQIFMSPGDVWTTEITQDAVTGRSQLTTYDNTCTIPSVYDYTQLNGPVPFKFTRVAPQDDNFTDAMRAAHTREGYVEIFNMADIPPLLASAQTTNPLYTAIKHGTNGQPANCGAAAVTQLSTEGAAYTYEWLESHVLGAEGALEAAGFDVPTTGLMATSTIINTTTGFVSWSTNADAIVATDDTGLIGTGRVVFAKQTADRVDTQVTTPNSGTDYIARLLTNDPLLRLVPGTTGAITPLEVDFPDMSTPYVTDHALDVITDGVVTYIAPEDQTLTLTESIAKTAIYNEYLTTPSINARTDWAFSMPTRRYHVATAYRDAAAGPTTPVAVFHDPATTATAANPSVYFTAGNTAVGSTTAGDDLYSLLCVGTGETSPLSPWDREERFPTAAVEGPIFSPAEPGTTTSMRFCAEASVLSFNHPSEVLWAEIGNTTVTIPYAEGWAKLATPGLGTPSLGLPILGAAYTKIVGEVRNGGSTNYGLIQPHRY